MATGRPLQSTKAGYICFHKNIVVSFPQGLRKHNVVIEGAAYETKASPIDSMIGLSGAQHEQSNLCRDWLGMEFLYLQQVTLSTLSMGGNAGNQLSNASVYEHLAVLLHGKRSRNLPE